MKLCGVLYMYDIVVAFCVDLFNSVLLLYDFVVACCVNVTALLGVCNDPDLNILKFICNSPFGFVDGSNIIFPTITILV